MSSIFAGRGVRFAVAALALFTVAGGIAFAAIPDADGTYHACMLKNLGTIRIIDPVKQHCSAALETEITFNQKGSPGANGVSPTVAQLAAGDAHCATGGAAITDAAGTTAYVCNGLKGADGQDGADGEPFSGTFTSPNGQYSISVTDTGVTIDAPGATTVSVSQSGVTVQSDTALNLKGGTDVKVEGGISATVKANASATVQAGGPLELKGALVSVNGPGCAPAARVGDLASGAVGFGGGSFLAPIITGSPTVCIG